MAPKSNSSSGSRAVRSFCNPLVMFFRSFAMLLVGIVTGEHQHLSRNALGGDHGRRRCIHDGPRTDVLFCVVLADGLVAGAWANSGAGADNRPDFRAVARTSADRGPIHIYGRTRPVGATE